MAVIPAKAGIQGLSALETGMTEYPYRPVVPLTSYLFPVPCYLLPLTYSTTTTTAVIIG
jgi:hypothetical protein